MLVARKRVLRIAVACLAVFAFRAAFALASFHEVKDGWQPSEAYLLDRHGEVIHQLRLDDHVRRLEWTELKDISPALRKMILHAEDRRFEEHAGVDWKALGAAALGYLTGKGKRGASTIDMQVAAMLDSSLPRKSGKRNILQKWDQVLAAQELDRSWSKEEILETYLNEVTFRGEFQGVAAASRGLFGKSPSGLTEEESLLLAALLPSPNSTPTQVAKRACILAASLPSATTCLALERLAAMTLGSGGGIRIDHALAPHVAQKLLRSSGEKVQSTLDGRLQKFTTETLSRQLLSLNTQHVFDGAVLVVDNASGEVLAYVGNSGAMSSARFVDGVQAFRQAGSTLKPFLYGVAVDEKLLTAASLLDDSPVMIQTSGGLYVPQNYDKEFKGMVSVRTALASSINVPAVRTLTLIGTDTFYDLLKQLGYESLDESSDHYGYSLALGSADVSLWDQVNAYRTLANGGVWGEMRFIKDNKSIAHKRVFSQEAAFIISDILSDRGARSVTFGLDSPLVTRFWTAVKTGTSKDMRDNWCIGYSQKYTVGVWVGNFDGKPMWDISGITGAAPVWLEIMNYLHAKEHSEKPVPPPAVHSAQVNFEGAVEPPRRDWFIKGTEVTNISVANTSLEAARIVYPANGTIIALDQDIPKDRQVVFFEVGGNNNKFRLLLDGNEIADSQNLTKWHPTGGRHKLTLFDDRSKEIGSVVFQVRGVE